MLYNLQNEYEAERFKEHINKLYRERAVVEVKKKHPSRTLAQNAYLHTILGYFASQYGCSAEEAKVDFYKRTCNSDLFQRTRTNRQGRDVSYLRSSTELSTAEMSLSIERFRNWSAAVAAIYLPSAGEQQALLFAQQEIEQNNEFIY